MGKVTGIGGFFFKCQDTEALKSWYGKHLGEMPFGMQYPAFHWREPEDLERIGQTIWAPFKSDSDYFKPSTKPYMINFRVDDLNGLVASLREAGCLVDEKTEEFEYGKFGWVMDPEGNRLELWEPPSDLDANNNFTSSEPFPHVVGLGGVFLKARDPETLQAWYAEKLGIEPDKGGCICFHQVDTHDRSRKDMSLFTFFKEDTQYFNPSNKPYMPNYRVRDLDGLLARLKDEGVSVVDKSEDSDFGKFGWIVDPDGTKIELWQPPKA